MSSCTKDAFFVQSFSFKDNCWEQDVKPSFKVKITDTSKIYNFTLSLRTTTDYEFSNCWLYINSKTPQKQKAREPFEIKITKPDGTWIGKKSGTIVENVLIFKKRKFPKKGDYIFTIEQAVIQEKICEVLDIGLQIEEEVNN